jgi:SAM-dependent methyltransferase
MTDAEFLALLCCPYDRAALTHSADFLACEQGHKFAIYQDVPVLLRRDVQKTLAWDTLDRLDRGTPWPEGEWSPSQDEQVHPGVQSAVSATSGFLYEPLKGKLRTYPIPEIRLPHVTGDERLLDIGSGWGRWSVAAARKGYDVIGVEPQLGFCLIAQTVCRQLGIRPHFVAADARHLPFRDERFAVVFSYSVIQHFSKTDARASLSEIRRVLRPGGRSLVQMPNKFGVRSLYHQARARFKNAGTFRVRYWSPAELKQSFAESVGPSSLSVDGFLGLGIQPSDRSIMPVRNRAIIAASEMLRRVKPLAHFADSLYVASQKKAESKSPQL